MSETTGIELTTRHPLETPERMREQSDVSIKSPVPAAPAEVIRELIEINEARTAKLQSAQQETGTILDVYV